MSSSRRAGRVTRPPGQEYLEQEYQPPEVRFHTSLPYGGSLQPTNHAGKSMVWRPKG